MTETASLDCNPNQSVLFHLVAKPYTVSPSGDLVVSQGGWGRGGDRCAELRERKDRRWAGPRLGGDGQARHLGTHTPSLTPEYSLRLGPTSWWPLPASRRKHMGVQSYSGSLMPYGMCPTWHSLVTSFLLTLHNQLPCFQRNLQKM